MLLAHKIRLDPNNVQRTYLARAAGTARFAHNWALAEWTRQYKASRADPTSKPPSVLALLRQLNSIKRSQFPWMLEVTKCAPQIAIMHLGRAFENFFAGRARYPKFRRKGVHDRFAISNEAFRVEGTRFRIPKLGWIRMCEPVRFEGHILSASLSRIADHWYVSFTVNCSGQSLPSAENQGAVGIDLGIETFATLSTGEKITGPRALNQLLGSVRRLMRTVSRKVKGSNNRAKAKLRLARLYERIAHIRRDSLHKLTTNVTQRFHTIGIEDLNVAGMLKNRRLARAISDMGWYQFRRQLEYKAALRGSLIAVIDRWYPSSKTCSACSHVLDMLSLDSRNWTCARCGVTHDRDINAAVNLKNMAVSSTVNACGGEGTGHAQAYGETGPIEAGIQLLS